MRAKDLAISPTLKAVNHVYVLLTAYNSQCYGIVQKYRCDPVSMLVAMIDLTGLR